MIPLLDSAKMAKLDRFTIESLGLPGAVLMETAGRAVYRTLLKRYPDILAAGRVGVVAGTGNNGGDGFVTGRYLLNQGASVIVFLLGKAGQLKGDAGLMMNAYLASGGTMMECGADDGIPQAASEADLLVDALFGTGLKKSLGQFHATWVQFMTRGHAVVVSVDMPSGVLADDGSIMGEAVHADLTVTFGHYKKGQFLGPGRELCGDLHLVDIGLFPQGLAEVKPDLYLLEEADFAGTFLRGADSHKGHYGHVAVVAGGRGRMGALGLASMATLKAGAGLVTALFPAGLMTEARFPMEVMTEPLGTGSPGPTGWSPALYEGTLDSIAKADALVIGPGMGLSTEVESLIELILGTPDRPPVVVDADALSLLALRKDWKRLLTPEDVLTPHPGEAARLLGVTNAEVQADRQYAVRRLAKEWPATVILKGAGTLLVQGKRQLGLVSLGNPGMATAGSGDVLSGAVGAFLARGLPSLEAASAGVYAHALAGDLAAAETGMEGLCAGDILKCLPAAMKKLSDNENFLQGDE